MTPPPRSLWLNPRVLLVVFLVFASGALAGALATRYGLQGRQAQPSAYYPIGDRRVALGQLVK